MKKFDDSCFFDRKELIVPKIERVNDSINLEDLRNIKCHDTITNFAKTMQEKYGDDNLILMNNNLKTLNVKTRFKINAKGEYLVIINVYLMN